MSASTYTEKDNSGFHWLIAALLLAALLILSFMGYGPFGSKCNPVAAPVAVAPPATVVTPPPAPAVVPPPAPVERPVAALPPPPPAAKVYFALDKTNTPTDVNKTLADVVAYLKANPDAKASISGFHDPTGNRAHNEDLAVNRARAVRAALETLGIPRERVIMQKPVETTGTGSLAEARRVEVSVAR